MGAKARRRQRFFSEHQLCCFCGGSALAVEEDHIPSKVMFAGRNWPEGFVFPACAPCNRATRDYEQVVAWLARMYPDPTEQSDIEEQKERFRAMERHFPEILAEMKPTARQLREAETKYGISPPPGRARDSIPVLSVRGEALNRAIFEFGRKLALALYYKHSGSILPSAGRIALRWYSNLQINADEIPRELASVLTQFPPLVRNSTSLGNQFFYRVGLADTKEMLAFLAMFRETFAIVGLVSVSGERLNDIGGENVYTPYKWS